MGCVDPEVLVNLVNLRDLPLDDSFNVDKTHVVATLEDLRKKKSYRFQKPAPKIVDASPAKSEAPKMDFIITVCDNAAGEVCPIWPGKPATAHWGFPDPSQVGGSDVEKRAAFTAVMNGLKKRIDLLASMPLEKLDSMALKDIHNKAQ